MKPSRFGPCGLYCGACGALDCDGCGSARMDDHARGCRFRLCAAAKKLVSCGYCGECPCPPLKEFMTDVWPHHRTMEPNLESISKDGLAGWLDAQKAKWTCRTCGEEIRWYQKTCACGRDLDGWDLPPEYRPE